MSPIKRPRFGGVFLFCPFAIQPRTSVCSAFCVVHAKLYHLRRKIVYRALQELFRLFAPFCACHPAAHFAMLYSLQGAGGHTSKRSASTDTRYQRHAGRCTSQHGRPITIRYRGAAYRRPCQSGGLQSGTGQQSGRTGWHYPPNRIVQRQGRGERRGTIDGYRRSLFGLSPDS